MNILKIEPINTQLLSKFSINDDNLNINSYYDNIYKIISNVYESDLNMLIKFSLLDEYYYFILKIKNEISHLIEDIGILTKEMVIIEEKDVKINVEYFYPNVIEPSFGIDRLLYAIYFNSFWERDSDENRTVLSFKQKLVPYDVAVLQLSNNEELMNKVNILSNEIRKLGYKVYNDQSSGSIGRRYSRLDKIGIKYTITVDFDSLKDNSVTIRERDLMGQERKTMIGTIHLKEYMDEINDAYGFEDIDYWCDECGQCYGEDGFGCTENECNGYCEKCSISKFDCDCG